MHTDACTGQGEWDYDIKVLYACYIIYIIVNILQYFIVI